MAGRLPKGNSSFGTDFESGNIRVPKPATGMTAWVIFFIVFGLCESESF